MNAGSEWAIVFQDAVHEFDPALADVKIRVAEAAIFDRIYSESRNAMEEQALLDAGPVSTPKVVSSDSRL